MQMVMMTENEQYYQTSVSELMKNTANNIDWYFHNENTHKSILTDLHTALTYICVSNK